MTAAHPRLARAERAARRVIHRSPRLVRIERAARACEANASDRQFASGAKGPGGSAKTVAAYEMMEWAPGAEEQVVLSNAGDQPVQFVEWTVAPPQGVSP